MTLFWLAVPAILTLGGVALLVAVHHLDAARRQLRLEVVALRTTRGGIEPVHRQIDETRAAATVRTHR